MGARERDEFLRAAWRAMLSELDARELVFVDEMGSHTSLVPLYAYSPRGCRAHVKVPRNRGPNTTLLSSMSVEGMGPSLTVEGTTNREVFEAYLEQVLTPALRHGQIVVMDNLTAHKGERVKEIIGRRGCELVYLPPYSPDFSPLEEAFSKIKGLVREAEARTREALVEVIGRALDAVSASDAKALFEHCGYHQAVQLL
jgi:transposase